MLDYNHCRICPDAIRDRHNRARIRVAWIAAGRIEARPAAAWSTPVACLEQVVHKPLRDETIARVPRRKRSLGRTRSQARRHSPDPIAVRRPSRDRNPEGQAAPKRPAAVLRDPHRIPAEGPVAKVALIESRNLIRKKSEV